MFEVGGVVIFLDEDVGLIVLGIYFDNLFG